MSGLLHALAELPRAYQDAEDLAEEANESTDGDREIAADDDHQQAQNHHQQFEIVQATVEEVRTSKTFVWIAGEFVTKWAARSERLHQLDTRCTEK